MKRAKMLVIMVFLTLTISACSSSGGGGGGGGSCSTDSDCSTYCAFIGEWKEGAAGSETNGGFCPDGSCYCCYALFIKDPVTGLETEGRCLGCDEGGVDCDWDLNYECFDEENVCLLYY